MLPPIQLPLNHTNLRTIVRGARGRREEDVLEFDPPLGLYTSPSAPQGPPTGSQSPIRGAPVSRESRQLLAMRVVQTAIQYEFHCNADVALRRLQRHGVDLQGDGVLHVSDIETIDDVASDMKRDEMLRHIALGFLTQGEQNFCGHPLAAEDLAELRRKVSEAFLAYGHPAFEVGLMRARWPETANTEKQIMRGAVALTILTLARDTRRISTGMADTLQAVMGITPADADYDAAFWESLPGPAGAVKLNGLADMVLKRCFTSDASQLSSERLPPPAGFQGADLDGKIQMLEERWEQGSTGMTLDVRSLNDGMNAVFAACEDY